MAMNYGAYTLDELRRSIDDYRDQEALQEFARRAIDFYTQDEIDNAVAEAVERVEEELQEKLNRLRDLLKDRLGDAVSDAFDHL